MIKEFVIPKATPVVVNQPIELTLEKLKYDPGFYPRNQRLAEVLYQTGYIERFGSGTGEIYRLCKEAGLQAPPG